MNDELEIVYKAVRKPHVELLTETILQYVRVTKNWDEGLARDIIASVIQGRMAELQRDTVDAANQFTIDHDKAFDF